MMGDLSAEPSMEEILSSIKRIIAEEGEAPGRPRRTPPRNPAPVPLPAPTPAARTAGPFDEVLELSDPMPATPAAAELARRAQAAEAISIAPRIASRWQEPVAAPEPVEEPPVQRAPERPPEPVAAAPEAPPIASTRTTEASRDSLDSLSRMIVRGDASMGGAADGTLEGMVREMLRPMLRDWLDAQLPAMVETMVAREIDRITHARG